MSDVIALSGGSGGVDRPAKKQKQNKIEAFGGPMDDEETARKKLEEVGFDPDRPSDSMSEIEVDFKGDLKMCRYLLSKGASTTQSWVDDDDESEEDNICPSPMYAAVNGGHLEVCKWLCDHGARGDIRRVNEYFHSPLRIAISQMSLAELDGNDPFLRISRWLILNEALCPNDDGVVCEDHIGEAFWRSPKRVDMRNWASGAIREHDNFMVFLLGTHIPAPFSNEELVKLLGNKLRSSNSASIIMESLSEHQQRSLWNSQQRQPSIVQCLSGHPGIRKHIADMIGVVRGRDLRILRGLERGLTSHYQGVA